MLRNFTDPKHHEKPCAMFRMKECDSIRLLFLIFTGGPRRFANAEFNNSVFGEGLLVALQPDPR